MPISKIRAVMGMPKAAQVRLVYIPGSTPAQWTDVRLALFSGTKLLWTSEESPDLIKVLNSDRDRAFFGLSKSAVAAMSQYFQDGSSLAEFGSFQDPNADPGQIVITRAK